VRPEFTGPLLVVNDWLRANGIDEPLPEQPDVTTYGLPGTGRIEYSSFIWEGERGWADGWADRIKYDEVTTMIPEEVRIVPYVVAPSDRVRDAAFTAGLALIERAA
jgi:hypothetical protein